MELIANILMTAAAFGAGLYCYILGLRLKKFTTLETGMGGAIAVLSAQVDDMTRALEAARTSATGSVTGLEVLAVRAEAAARRLELLMASLHGLDEAEPAPEAEPDPDAEADKKLRFVRRRPARDFAEAAE